MTRSQQLAKVISIHDAKVKTMSVGIKAMTISDRQVTLALFRQLIEEELIDYYAGTLNGLPWGFVNYCPDNECRCLGTHWHIVWQKGDELRRATVWKELFEVKEPLTGNKERFKRMKREITELPQLFIAV